MQYGNHIIYLFMGGFFIAVTMERWNLHRRIALNIIRQIGTRPDRIILGFMVASAVLSMWVSNTATAMMMVPIGLAVIKQSVDIIEEQEIQGIDTTPRKFNFATALMLNCLRLFDRRCGYHYWNTTQHCAGRSCRHHVWPEHQLHDLDGIRYSTLPGHAGLYLELSRLHCFST